MSLFTKHINNFSSSLHSLREFNSHLSPILEENVKATLGAHSQFFNPLLDAIKELRKTIKEDQQTPDQPRKIKFENFEIEKVIDNNKNSLVVSFEKNSIEIAARREIASKDAQIKLLNNSTLLSLISSSEWFISRLMYKFVQLHPECINLNEKNLSFKQIKNLGSIDEAVEFLINTEIEQVMRGSFEDWIKFIKSKSGAKIGYLNQPLELINEIYLRRNLLVHNNGLVNSIYLSKLTETQKKDVKIGEDRSPDKDYLHRSINLIELNLILIAAEIWKNLEPESTNRSITLQDIAYQHLSSSNYEISLGLSKFLANDDKATDAYKTVGQINYWLSMKYLGRLDQIRKEVEASDFSSKSLDYIVCRYAVLDDYENLNTLIPKALEKDIIKKSYIDEWPAFKNFRESIHDSNMFSNSISIETTESIPEEQPKEAT